MTRFLSPRPRRASFLTWQPVLTGLCAHFGLSKWVLWSSTPLLVVVTP